MSTNRFQWYQLIAAIPISLRSCPSALRTECPVEGHRRRQEQCPAFSVPVAMTSLGGRMWPIFSERLPRKGETTWGGGQWRGWWGCHCWRRQALVWEEETDWKLSATWYFQLSCGAEIADGITRTDSSYLVIYRVNNPSYLQDRYFNKLWCINNNFWSQILLTF